MLSPPGSFAAVELMCDEDCSYLSGIQPLLKIKQPSNAEPETDTKGMAEEVGAPEVAAPTL